MDEGGGGRERGMTAVEDAEGRQRTEPRGRRREEGVGEEAGGEKGG